jgi:hypothetical protein
MGSTKPRTIIAMASSSLMPRHEVEELVVAHLRDGRLVAHRDVVLADVDVRVGVRAADRVDEQRVAAHRRGGVVAPLEHLHQAAVGRPATAARHRLRDDRRGGVRGACTILAPASWCWPSPAKAIDSVSPLACSPIRKIAGYFIVTLEPMLPSTHSMVAPSAAVARLVTRLYTLFDQFWMVVYRTRASS